MQDDFEKDWSDDDWSDDDYGDDDDSPEYVACPICNAPIYEDTVRCPECGEYITGSTSPWTGRPTWYILLGLAGILAVIASIIWFG